MNKEEIETGVSHIAYFRTDGGSCKLYTQEYVDEKDKEIERLSKDCDIWNRKYNEQFDRAERLNNIINELEKELREGSFDVYFCSTASQKTFKSNEIIIKAMILDKLKKLKEGKEDE